MAGLASGRSDVERGVERKSDRRQANFRAASLIAQLERDMLRAERSARQNAYWNPKRDRIFVDI